MWRKDYGDSIEAYCIHLLSSVEAAFQKVYEDYVKNYEKFEMVVSKPPILRIVLS